MNAPAAVVTVRLFAAAAHACGLDELRVTATDLAQALAAVTERAADPARFAAVLSQCSVLVDGRYHSPSSSLSLPVGATVDVLPPFAGG